MSSGAFSWCRVWGALQAGSLWGYEPLPPPLPGYLLLHVPQGSGGDGGHSPTTGATGVLKGVLKKWSLAPTEGPERARIRMHQDFEVSEALSEHEASVAATARRNETAVKALERSSNASTAMSNGMEGIFRICLLLPYFYLHSLSMTFVYQSYERWSFLLLSSKMNMFLDMLI